MAVVEELPESGEAKNVGPSQVPTDRHDRKPLEERTNGRNGSPAKLGGETPPAAAQPLSARPGGPTPSIYSMSPGILAVLILGFVSVLHLAGLVIFTRGFLLSRKTLEDRSGCGPDSRAGCTLDPSHSKAIVIVVDALRYDFLLPHAGNGTDVYAHNHLTTPGRLTAEDPTRSMLFHFVADPPTTTLQRLKGLTTGSLPTFIDAGSNFASANIGIDEDSWIEQLYRAGKRLGFAGDDTWTGLFGKADFGGFFKHDLTYPYPSFDVEDLDTVDNGVENSLLPLIEDRARRSDWDILIGHFLGLDHVGHRVGPSHQALTRKLRQYNRFIDRVVEAMDSDTLLIVMGDHGMDAKGDHGGDGVLEVSSGLWLYSKKRPLRDKPDWAPDWALDEEDFVDLGPSLGRHRTVPQISLVPTLSMLLGVAIPFSNLGMLIPEPFLRATFAPGTAANPKARKGTGLSPSETLLEATRVNAGQIMRYIEKYAGGPKAPGKKLAPQVPRLRELYTSASSLYWAGKPGPAFNAYRVFSRETLEQTRRIWARFSPGMMIAGITVLAASCIATIKLAEAARWTTIGDAAPIRRLAAFALPASVGGAVLGLGASLVPQITARLEQPWHVLTLSGFTVGAIGGLFTPTVKLPIRQGLSRALRPSWGILPLFLHAGSFASNSFTLWEDKIVLSMLVASLCVPVALHSLDSRSTRLKSRLIVFPLLLAACSRLMSISTLCREEQHPYCRVTFFASSTSSVASSTVMALLFPAALALPLAFAWFMGFSDSYQGASSFFFGGGMRLSLLLGAQYWVSEKTLSSSNLAEVRNAIETGSWLKQLAARFDLWLCALGATVLWFILPLCLEIERDDAPVAQGAKPRVTVIGFANSYGSSYLMFFGACFCALYLVTQPTGQLVLGLGIVAILSLVEINDSLHDAASMRMAFTNAIAKAKGGTAFDPANVPSRESVASPSFLTISALVLLSYVIFFATGHQATFASIQWKVAFVGFDTVTYPWSPLLVILNTLGPFMLCALAVPLLVFWNFSPKLARDGEPAKVPLTSELLRACLRFSTYHAVITLSTAVWAAHFRRHLMVWKVFAPRFMLAGVTLLAVDWTLTFLAMGWGSLVTISKVRRAFKTKSV